MAQGQKLKIDLILDWLDQSDYYQILNVSREANSAQIKSAYFALSKQYHPDKFFVSADKSTRGKITRVFKRLNEAYMILKDSQKRKRYDEMAFGTDRQKFLRYQKSEEDRSGPANPEDQAKTANGKKYLKLALAAQVKKDWRAAEMNLQFALNFEGDNEVLKKMMAKVQEKIKKLPKEDPFKIR